jgi:hypothetical protein
MRENLRSGIRMLVLFVLAGVLLMLPRSAKADYIPQDIIINGNVNFNHELAINNAGASSLALVGLGAVLVALGFKRRRS